MFADLLVSPLSSLWLVLLPCKDAGGAAAQEGCFAFCQSFIHLSLSQSISSVLDMGAQGERHVHLCAGSSISGVQLGRCANTFIH